KKYPEAEILNILALTYLAQENYDESITIFEKITKAFPQNNPAFYNLADAYFKKGEVQKAKENYQKALDLFNGFEEAAIALANIYAEEKNEQMAVKILENVLKNTTSPLIEEKLKSIKK
ncbi:MAG: tetratricopeptide repeat protein, partial [Candidatus Gastranaerophilales bacterium]|nr:tetratricopeptide repeat protein [Candidatus Gastranaerophilales bacterium]